MALGRSWLGCFIIGSSHVFGPDSGQRHISGMKPLRANRDCEFAAGGGGSRLSGGGGASPWRGPAKAGRGQPARAAAACRDRCVVARPPGTRPDGRGAAALALRPPTRTDREPRCRNAAMRGHRRSSRRGEAGHRAVRTRHDRREWMGTGAGAQAWGVQLSGPGPDLPPFAEPQWERR